MECMSDVFFQAAGVKCFLFFCFSNRNHTTNETYAYWRKVYVLLGEVLLLFPSFTNLPYIYNSNMSNLIQVHKTTCSDTWTSEFNTCCLCLEIQILNRTLRWDNMYLYLAIVYSFFLFILVRLWNKHFFAYVNHARIRSLNQPVLSN